MKHMRWVLAAALLPACGGGSSSSGSSGLAALDDEFGGSSLGGWTRLLNAEQWPNDQIESFDVGTTRSGWLTVLPYPNAWYSDYRGDLFFKTVTGDFIVTALVETFDRAGTAIPGDQYSLAGIMIRAPRNVTPGTWTPGGENYLHFAAGVVDSTTTRQINGTSTANSASSLNFSALSVSAVTLRIARIGPDVILLCKPAGGAWVVNRRWLRADLPAALQVGIAATTDWGSCSALSDWQHNTTQITTGNPDLLAQVDYVRFTEAVIPPALSGLDIGDPGEVSDAQLLSFLGFD